MNLCPYPSSPPDRTTNINYIYSNKKDADVIIPPAYYASKIHWTHSHTCLTKTLTKASLLATRGHNCNHAQQNTTLHLQTQRVVQMGKNAMRRGIVHMYILFAISCDCDCQAINQRTAVTTRS